MQKTYLSIAIRTVLSGCLLSAVPSANACVTNIKDDNGKITSTIVDGENNALGAGNNPEYFSNGWNGGNLIIKENSSLTLNMNGARLGLSHVEGGGRQQSYYS